MYFQQLQAFVSFSTAPRSEGKPQVNARSWLSCPHCRNVIELVGPQINLQAERKRLGQVMRAEVTDFPPQTLQEFVYRQMTAFRVNQNCAQCGIISTLPAADLERMKKELSKIITTEWLNAQIDSLMMCVPFQDHQTDLAATRTASDGAASRALIAASSS